MKKRVLSVALSAIMVFSSFSAVFAADTAETVYEGNTPLITAEKILDELNVDAATESGIFDQEERAEQLAKIADVNESLASKTYLDADMVTALSDCIALVCADERMTDYKKQYLAALVKAYDENNATIEAGLKAPDTSDKNLKDSFALLDDYVDNMEGLFAEQGITAGAYNTPEVAEKAAKYVAEPLIALMKIMFAQDGTADDETDYTGTGKYTRENYIEEFLKNDRAKKTLAVLFGAALTEEIVSDSANGENEKGIVRHVKDYVSEELDNGADGILSELSAVMVSDGAASVSGAFEFLGSIVSAAYEGDPIQSDVIMVMGDGDNKKGLFELLVEAADAELTAANVWINLFLGEYIQLNLVSGPLNTVCKLEAAAPVQINDNASVTFKTEGLASYGVSDLSLRTGWFDVVCYVEDAENPGTYTATNYVTYEDGKIQITNDGTKGDNYPAYLVLYRADGDAEGTFVESYPVTVSNRVISQGSGGGGVARYAVKYETNGGEALEYDYFAVGTTVQLTKVPVKEGYVFAGWYLDEALTQKADSVVMNGTVTVYAAWVKDGSSVVSGVEIPEMLSGGEHFAYIQGYPGDEVRPQANITRAETVTILFRLLKDEVRGENLKTDNSFTDVNAGDWYNTAVSTLAGLGIVNGRTETEFMPDEYITRAELATIFARLADYDYEATITFDDIEDHWAEDNILEAAAYGWIAGYEDGSFRPDRSITRAETMTIVNRVLKRMPKTTEDLLEGMNEWIDNSESAWYYLAVQEATNSHKFEMKDASYEKWTELTENKDWSEYEN